MQAMELLKQSSYIFHISMVYLVDLEYQRTHQTEILHYQLHCFCVFANYSN